MDIPPCTDGVPGRTGYTVSADINHYVNYPHYKGKYRYYHKSLGLSQVSPSLDTGDFTTFLPTSSLSGQDEGGSEPAVKCQA